MTVDGKLDVPALYGLDRPDVAKAFNNPKFRYSGYIATFSSSILGRGDHTISLKIVSKDGKHYYLPALVVFLTVK